MTYTIEYQYLTTSEYDSIYALYGNLTNQLLEKVSNGNFNIIFQEYCFTDNCSDKRVEVYAQPKFYGPYINSTSSGQASSQSASSAFMQIIIIIPIVVCVFVVLLACIFYFALKRYRTEKNLGYWIQQDGKVVAVESSSMYEKEAYNYTPQIDDIYNPPVSDRGGLAKSTDSVYEERTQETTDSIRKSLQIFQSSLIEIRKNSQIYFSSSKNNVSEPYYGEEYPL